MIEKFSVHLDTGAQIDNILLDFSKALKKAPQQHPFLKLAHYGIQGPMLAKDFLTNRTQLVVLICIYSIRNSINVLSGVFLNLKPNSICFIKSLTILFQYHMIILHSHPQLPLVTA